MTDEERLICARNMERLIQQKPTQFRTGKHLLCVLLDTGVWKDIGGSRGELLCCIVRDGEEHTWMRRERAQTAGKGGKGCKQQLRVNKILWA